MSLIFLFNVNKEGFLKYFMILKKKILNSYFFELEESLCGLVLMLFLPERTCVFLPYVLGGYHQRPPYAKTLLAAFAHL